MAEFFDGFVPFKTYEVGNDINPFGWNNASAMTLSSGTVTGTDASGNSKVFNVIKPVVNIKVDYKESEEYDPFVQGVWNGIKTGEGSTYIPPSISNISFTSGSSAGPLSANSVLNKASENFIPQNYSITYNCDPGTSGDASVIISFYNKNGTEITDPYTYEVTAAGVQIINLTEYLTNPAISSENYVKIVISATDGQSTTVSSQELDMVYPIIYGAYSAHDILDPAKELSATVPISEITYKQVSNEICAYNCDSYVLKGEIVLMDERSFYYIAVPSAMGPINDLSNGINLSVPMPGAEIQPWHDVSVTTAKVFNNGYYLYNAIYWANTPIDGINHDGIRFTFKTKQS